jgi:serine/threonine-protein kinase
MSLSVSTVDTNEGDSASGTHRCRSPVPGQLLGGKYRVESLIAEGGMGLVLRAQHLDLDCPVAIKLIRPEYAENEEVVGRLLTEARIAAGLRSKHVNRVLDVGRTTSGAPYLVLELMEGGDLRRRLDCLGPMPVTEAVDCVMQACEALAEAHALGIVHRDLKPENLFMNEEADGSFVLKVLDFGISKAPAARRVGRTLTNPFEVVGSPNYMAPEQVRGGVVDARSDIWALGALLYELCSGQVPFSAETVTETFVLIVDENYELPRLELGPDADHLDLVIRRCLRKNPDERFRDVTELADALSPLSSDAQQGRRVARVAVATRARIEAAAEQDGRATPVALSSSLRPESESLFEPFPRARRSRLAWVLGGAAALSLLGLCVRYASAPAPQASAAAIATAAPAPVGAVAEPAASQPAPEPAVSKRAEPLHPVAPTTRPARARPWAFKRAPVQVEPATVAAPVTAPPEPPAAIVPSARAAANAWDPKSFGGRR